METLAFQIVAGVGIAVVIVIALATGLRTILETLAYLPLPDKLANYLRNKRVQDTTELLRQLSILQRLRMHQQVTEYQALPEGEGRQMYLDHVTEMAKKYRVRKNVVVGKTYSKSFPYFIDLMSATTDERDVRVLARALASFIKDEASSLRHSDPILLDKIVVPAGGSPVLGHVLAQTINKPLVLFRGNENPKIREPVPHDLPPHFHLYFNGKIDKGDNVILVDDSATGGRMFGECLEKVRELGASVNHAFILFEPDGGGARELLKSRGVALHSIVKVDDEYLSTL